MQSIVYPNGLIATMEGPYFSNDLYVLRVTNTLDRLEALSHFLGGIVRSASARDAFAKGRTSRCACTATAGTITATPACKSRMGTGTGRHLRPRSINS